MTAAQRSTEASPNGAAAPQETTPLLARAESKDSSKSSSHKYGRWSLYRVLLCAFMVSLSFGVTQVPLIYVFRIMVCEAYYEERSHQNPVTLESVPMDPRCNKRDIEAGTARAISLLGASTTLFGLVNLLITSWTIKRLGVKRALLIQVFFPAVRVAIQSLGVTIGSNPGVIIVQASQIITIVGGPNGYVLALNTMITEVVPHEERTPSLGRLQGAMMVGMATGILTGGAIGDAWGVVIPFRVTVGLFLVCCTYVMLVLPSIENKKDDDQRAGNDGKSRLARFFGPLHILAPQKWRTSSGHTTTNYGTLTLGIGVFLGLLATGYIPTLLQMYSTNEFGFGTAENGRLVFAYSLLRGLFLSIVFPRIIAFGRKLTAPKEEQQQEEESVPEASESGARPITTRTSDDTLDNRDEPDLENVPAADTDPPTNTIEPPTNNPPSSNTPSPTTASSPQQQQQHPETFIFDLFYARASLLADAILTGLAVLVNRGWQLYLFAVFIPLAAGTGAASKGVVIQMLPKNERVDALGGMALVENVGRLCTTAVFGLIFAALAEVGKSYLVFVCNAAVALLGVCALLLSRFPPRGSTRV